MGAFVQDMSVDTIIINLTRFGDLLQTQATIDDLHNSGHRVGLVCLANFTPATRLLRNLQTTWELPGSKLLSALDSDWSAASEIITDFARDARTSGTPGHIVNLTPTLPARLLSRMLALDGAAVYGFGLDEFGYGVNHGVWSSFVAVAAARRGNSPFNLSDMFRMLASPLTKFHSGQSRLREPDPSDMQWARDFLSARTRHLPAQPKGFVAFQLGASEERRRWPVDNFRLVGKNLWEQERLCPILTGTQGEKALLAEYRRLAREPFVNAIGMTSIHQLAALLSQCRFLLTNDTGTMHLAAGLGTPSLSFFMATAQPWDTGPALPGCCCLEPAIQCHPCPFGRACPSSEVCRIHMDARCASDLALNFARNGAWENADGPGLEGKCRIWLTALDERGMNTLIPLNENAANGPGLWMRWQRRFWSALLNAMDAPPESGLAPNYDGLPKPENAADMSLRLRHAAELLQTVSECGSNAARTPALGKIFLKNCERLQALLDSWPSLTSLGAFWRQFRTSHGHELEKFCRQTTQIADHAIMLANALQK